MLLKLHTGPLRSFLSISWFPQRVVSNVLLGRITVQPRTLLALLMSFSASVCLHPITSEFIVHRLQGSQFSLEAHKYPLLLLALG